MTTLKRHSMINTVTAKIILRKDQPTPTGECSLCLQAFVNGKKCLILLAKMQPKHFDEKKELARKNCPGAVHYNKLITDARTRVVAVLSEANVQNIQLTRDTFRLRYTQQNSGGDFLDFYEKELKRRAGELQSTTQREHRKTLNKLRNWKGTVSFADITPQWLRDFETYIVRKEKNQHGSVWANLKNVRTYYNRARAAGLATGNPFENYQLRKPAPRIVYCTQAELQRILQHYRDGKLSAPHTESALCFLVSSFTGLRISDVRRLQPHWVNKGALLFTPHKTKRYGRPLEIPLSQVAHTLVRDLLHLKQSKVLKTDPHINKDLKQIGALCGVETPLTTHVGRHTFATMFLEMGGKIEVLQQLLGHASINETMIYGHVADTRKKREMQNFDLAFQ